MGTYCVSCKNQYCKKKILVLGKTKQNSLMFLSNRAVCDKKKLSFIKNQELHQVVFNNFNNI